MKKLLFACLLILSAGCTDASIGQLQSFGSKFKVTVYSGGHAVATYTSSGKVATESESDGWFFKDAETGRFIRVSGTITVEQIQ